jgi:aminoglycoside phosphotransferase (APT) family kinase protein
VARALSSPPWEADRLLTLEGARAIIGASFPEVDLQRLEYLGSGWEFDAYLTADSWVFRFPRRAWCERLFESERLVHELVSPVLRPSVAIPNVELMGEPNQGFPYRFAGHRFICGVPADQVNPSVDPTLAKGIGRALAAIHSIPEADARAAGVVELDMEEEGRLEWLQRGLEYASGLRGIDPTIDPALDWAGRVSLPSPHYEGQLRFIHHDLSPEHLIVDPDTGELAGILDWTDAILGDPARDLAALVACRGWSFAEAVLRDYDAPVGAGFRERVSFMARLLTVIWLANAHVQGSDVAKHVEWVCNAFADR